MCIDSGGHISGGAACERVAHDQTVATWTAVISYAVGGAAAITGGYLWWTDPRPSEGKQHAWLRCGPGGTPTSVTCAVTY
jgi:hypothetical protein